MFEPSMLGALLKVNGGEAVVDSVIDKSPLASAGCAKTMPCWRSNKTNVHGG